MAEPPLIPVIDLFAGPGGLGEGFSAYEDPSGRHPFRIRQSIEKDPDAHQTLRLRSFFRQFSPGNVPDLYYDLLRQKFPFAEFPERLKDVSPALMAAWMAADSEAMRMELGASPADHEGVSRKIRKVLQDCEGRWVLIGGPPCQAYSVVGRSRNRGITKYRIENDHRSSLYREYLRIIADHWPAVFVLENVKGMLSAKLGNHLVFDQIVADLQSPRVAMGNGERSRPSQRYRILPILESPPTLLDAGQRARDFIVECENFGIPQQRHRVILVGIREDLGDAELPRLKRAAAPTVGDIIGSLPKLRSGVSRTRKGDRYIRMQDSSEQWLETIRELTIRDIVRGERSWLTALRNQGHEKVADVVAASARSLKDPEAARGSEFIPCQPDLPLTHPMRNWLIDERLGGVCNHESRLHMDSDLVRYMYAAAYAVVYGVSPLLAEFPARLLPKHANAATGDFDDRFRVQVAGRPATTITSHLSKDGHYYIHPDPAQCRALTVREAARLQTFPDNYLFCGPRTSQYVQVGNAVPPLLARNIAECIWKFLVESGSAE